MIKVKICCISSMEEAKIAYDCGADVLGLVGAMPSGPGIIEDELIHKISEQYSSVLDTFLLTSETKAESIVNHHSRTRTTSVQLVDRVRHVEMDKIKKTLLGVKLVLVIHILNRESIIEAMEATQSADMLLLDSGNPNLAIKKLGGTGTTHNWKISAEIRSKSSIPVYLAGGLNLHNVRQAIDVVRPHGVDICSGVRTNGTLDSKKLEKFIRLAKS